MIKDYENVFSLDQAVTVTAASTNIIDLGNDSALVQAINEKGVCELVVLVTTTFAGGTSLSVTLQSDDDVAFGSPTTIFVTAAKTVASNQLDAGVMFPISTLPVINEQYLRLYYTVVGTMSAGNIFAALAIDRQTNGI